MIAIETQIRLYSSALLSGAPDYSVAWTARLRLAPKFHSERALTHRQAQENSAFQDATHIYWILKHVHTLLQRTLDITHSFNRHLACSVPRSTCMVWREFSHLLG